jgi:hypothetical protein
MGSGHVDGEILETLWSQLNLISGSTRGMSTSHRQEVLDDHMNDSNWKKLVKIGKVAFTLVFAGFSYKFNISGYSIQATLEGKIRASYFRE